MDRDTKHRYGIKGEQIVDVTFYQHVSLQDHVKHQNICGKETTDLYILEHVGEVHVV